MARPNKLNTITQEAIIKALSMGATYRDAAEAAGVKYETFNNWMKRGSTAKSGQFLEFFNLVRTTEAQTAVNFASVLAQAAAKGDWKPALEWLKRRRKEDWRDNLDVTSDGNRVELVVKYDTSRDTSS